MQKCNIHQMNNHRKALLCHLQFCHWPVCPLCSPLRSVFPPAAAPPAAPAAWGWQRWTGDPCRNSEEVNQRQCHPSGFLPYNPLLDNYTKEDSKEPHFWAVLLASFVPLIYKTKKKPSITNTSPVKTVFLTCGNLLEGALWRDNVLIIEHFTHFKNNIDTNRAHRFQW